MIIMPNVDIIIFISFLAINLGVGLWYGRGVKTLRQYAIGDKKFPTIVIALTIAATYITGTSLGQFRIYQVGLLNIIGHIRGPLGLALLGFCFLRAGEFLEHLTIAEAMGSMYGKTARIVTAISGILSNLGLVAMQFRVGAMALEHLLGIEEILATIIIGGTIIIYSALGGIKAVTFTDVLQFILIGIFIPLLVLKIWYTNSSVDLLQTVAKNPTLSINELISTYQKSFHLAMMMLPFGSILWLSSPVLFQRMQLSKDVYQAKKSFVYATAIVLLINVLVIWITLLVKVENPNLLSQAALIKWIITQYATPGFKGVIAIGIIAMVMSSSDSFINSTTILLVHDIAKPLGFIKTKGMFLIRLSTGLVGSVSIFIALMNYGITEIMAYACIFSTSVILVPLLLGLLGFRSSSRAVLIGMSVGFLVALLTSLFESTTKSIFKIIDIRDFNNLGMLANFITLITSHYLLGEKSWKGIKEPGPVILQGKIRKAWWKNLWESLFSKSLQERLILNLPTQQEHYFLIGLYAFLTNFLAVHGVDHKMFQTTFFQTILYTLFGATSLIMTYPAWPDFIKKKKFTAWAYPLLLGYTLFVVTPLITALVDFKPIYLFLLLVHTIVAMSVLHGWVVLLMGGLGSVVSASLLTWLDKPLLPAYFSWQISMLFGGVLLLILVAMIAKNQARMQKLFIQNHYVQRANRTLNTSMLKLNTSEIRFVKRLGFGQYNGLNKVHAVSEGVIDEMKAKNIDSKIIAKSEEIAEEIKTNADYLDQMIHYIENSLNIYRHKIVINKLLDTLKKRYAAMESGIKLFIDDQSERTFFSGDTEKVEEMLVFLIDKAANTDKTPYVFITITSTTLRYPRSRAPREGVAFAITAGANTPTIQQTYSHIDRPIATLAAIEVLVDQHYGCLASDKEGYVLALPLDVKGIRPSIKELAPKKLENWILIDAKKVEGAFWAKLDEKKCAKDYKLSRIQLALDIMKAHHGYEDRKSGHLFYTHPIHVAIEAMNHSDSEDIIIAALLHDTIEDTSKTKEEVILTFGKRVAQLTGLLTNQKTAFKKYELSYKGDKVVELSLSDDSDAILIKLCDRLHNMRTLSAKVAHKRIAKANQTLGGYVPLARKFGFENMAQELEDLCNLYLSDPATKNEAKTSR